MPVDGKWAVNFRVYGRPWYDVGVEDWLDWYVAAWLS